MKESVPKLTQRKRGNLARIVSITSDPLRTKQKRDRLDLLRQPYTGARYHDNYKITPQKLKDLARCIELLKEQTETSCEEKVDSFV